MNPSEYLSFRSVDLVATARRSRSAGSASFVRSKSSSEKGSQKFSLFFDSKSELMTQLAPKKYSGNCRVFFGGRIVIGPRWDCLLISLSLLVLVGTYVVCAVTAPILSSDSASGDVSKLLAWVVNIDFVACFVLMVVTSITNPGIIPRNESWEEHLVLDPRMIDSTTGFLLPRYLLLNGVCVRQKYCRTCRIYRPPRSNHCSVCDNCYLRHDHHCVALGTCVGLGNYRWFLMLSAGLTLLCPLVFWLTQRKIVDAYYSSVEGGAASFAGFVVDNALALVVLTMALVGSGASLLLFVYHYFITAHNLTTNEHLKKYYKVNPFDYGKWANFKHVVCYPQELLPVKDAMEIDASYRELGSTNSECFSDFYDY